MNGGSSNYNAAVLDDMCALFGRQFEPLPIIMAEKRNYDEYSAPNFAMQAIQPRKKRQRCSSPTNITSCFDDSFTRPRRRVHFGGDAFNTSYDDQFSKSERENLCYSSHEIKEFTRDSCKIIALLRHHQNLQRDDALDESSSSSLSCENFDQYQLCIRGLERYLIPKVQRKRRHVYIKSIVQAQKQFKHQRELQLLQFDYKQQQQFEQQEQEQQFLLATYSWKMSQEHVQQARDRAIQDEVFVHQDLYWW